MVQSLVYAALRLGLPLGEVLLRGDQRVARVGQPLLHRVDLGVSLLQLRLGEAGPALHRQIGQGLGLAGLVQLLLRQLQLMLLHAVVVDRHRGERALLRQLELAQRLLGGFQLLAVALAEDEEHVALRDQLPGFDHDRTDLAGLRGLDLVGAGRRDGAGAADAGGDGPAAHVLGADLRQRVIHDGIGKKSQDQEDRQKNDDRIFDPGSFFDFRFHKRQNSLAVLKTQN